MHAMLVQSTAPMATLCKLGREIALGHINDTAVNQVEAILDRREEHLAKLEFDPKSRATGTRNFNDFERLGIVKEAHSVMVTTGTAKKLHVAIDRNVIMPIGR